MQWFALRVSYNRGLKARALLEEAGFQTYLPLVRKKITRLGKTMLVTVPAISNLIFVRAEFDTLDFWLRNQGEVGYIHFMWDKSTRKPIVVRDKAMDDFIKISSIDGDDAIILTEVSPALQKGSLVRVVTGPFSGVEGRVVRIRKSRRVVVELSGLVAIATADFANPADLEVIRQ